MLSLSSRTRWEIAALTDREIRATFAGDRGSPPPQNATEALGIAISTALPLAAESWATLMRKQGVRARLIGAFSFGAPQVGFVDALGGPRACSLADLMIVLDDFRASSPGRRALLARIAAASDREANAVESPAIADLHDRWPAFRFCSDAYSDRPRRLSGVFAGDAPGPSLATVIELGPTPSSAKPAAMGLGAILAAMVSGAVG